LLKTRIHGDLHLGQVLVVQNDWYVIDFEGQPANSLERRRRKDSPLRDIAGVLRSFDYAAQSARRRTAAAVGGTGVEALGEQAILWRDHASAAFFEAYRQAIGDLPSYPQGADRERDWLNFFLLEKACYELRYEAMNRPDWLELPIKGIVAILDSYKQQR
jgi:maltose alpha-D-glucosyltransferase/alpha-amylase